MSTLMPHVYAPYPNLAADEAGKPYEPGPVKEVDPVAPSRPVESPENRAPDEALVNPDAMEVTEEARKFAQSTLQRRLHRGPVARQSSRLAFDPVRDAERIRNNRAIRELLASMEEYDNSVARERFGQALNLFLNYNNPYTVTGEVETAFYALSPENNVYSALGFSTTDITPREMREHIALAIDRWLQGEGVFLPNMLNYASTYGFRFAPLSEASRMALRAGSVLATHERSRIAAFLREMALLTPKDFIIYDTTGLGALPLAQRCEFIAWVDNLLGKAKINVCAAELQYVFDEHGKLQTVQMEPDDETVRSRLEELSRGISGYYAVLMDSVQQYDAGIISKSLV